MVLPSLHNSITQRIPRSTRTAMEQRMARVHARISSGSHPWADLHPHRARVPRAPPRRPPSNTPCPPSRAWRSRAQPRRARRWWPPPSTRAAPSTSSATSGVRPTLHLRVLRWRTTEPFAVVRRRCTRQRLLHTTPDRDPRCTPLHTNPPCAVAQLRSHSERNTQALPTDHSPRHAWSPRGLLRARERTWGKMAFERVSRAAHRLVVHVPVCFHVLRFHA